MLTYTCADYFWDSVVTNSRSMQISQTYVAIPQFFMPFGTLVMTLQFAAEVMRSVLLLRSGRVGDVEAESTLLVDKEDRLWTYLPFPLPCWPASPLFC